MLNLNPYCIVLRYSAPLDNWVLFLDMHMQFCVPPNIDLICGLGLIYLCGLLSVSDDTDYLYIASYRSQFI